MLLATFSCWPLLSPLNPNPPTNLLYTYYLRCMQCPPIGLPSSPYHLPLALPSPLNPVDRKPPINLLYTSYLGCIQCPPIGTRSPPCYHQSAPQLCCLAHAWSTQNVCGGEFALFHLSELHRWTYWILSLNTRADSSNKKTIWGYTRADTQKGTI